MKINMNKKSSLQTTKNRDALQAGRVQQPKAASTFGQMYWPPLTLGICHIVNNTNPFGQLLFSKRRGRD